jgi:DNA-binding CsgD family transcriptional regulator
MHVATDGEVLLLRIPFGRERWPLTFTAAERSVAGLIVDGAGNAEIARARGTSKRTISNQIASIFRKAGVGSRAELAALVFRGE